MEFSLTRTLPASPAAAYARFLDPQLPGSPWFNPGRVQLHFTPRPDAIFYFALEDQGRRWPQFGRFLRLEAPSLVEFTWMSPLTGGEEATLTLTLASHPEGALATLRQTGLPGELQVRQNEAGWAWLLGELAEALAAA